MLTIRRTAILALFALLCLSGSSLAIAAKVKDPKTLDYFDPDQRYAWYQACRNYLIKHGGVNCAPGYSLKISKDGHFTTNALAVDKLPADKAKQVSAANQACAASVKNKKFPLPSNAPVENFIFPIRDSKAKAWSRAELDRQVFQITSNSKK